MRVGILSNGQEEYGIRRSMETMFRGFPAVDIQPVLISLQRGEISDLAEHEGVPVMECDLGLPSDFGGLGDAIANFWYVMMQASRLAETLRAASLDALIVRTPFIAPLAARAAWLAQVRGFWWLPNLVSDRYPFRLNAHLYDIFMARYRMTLVANSHYTRTSLVNRMAPARVAHLGVDPVQFDPATRPADRGKYGFKDSDALFGVFARLQPDKGQLELVQAFAQTRHRYPAMRLAIWGGPADSEYAKAIRREISASQLDDVVRLGGVIGDLEDSLPALYAMCDVVVNARQDAEPFGLSVIEAMLMGKPVLVHALGGPAETVTDNANGWHAKTATPHGLAHGLARAMLDRDRWPAMGQAGAVAARADFTHARAAERIRQVILQPTYPPGIGLGNLTFLNPFTRNMAI
jgi:glycosyltransferase involved in cell wall biosynthesis